MVEVFKTNVEETDESVRIVEHLRARFPQNRINFDLTDCDRILRVEGDSVSASEIISLLTDTGYQCEVLL